MIGELAKAIVADAGPALVTVGVARVVRSATRHRPLPERAQPLARVRASDARLRPADVALRWDALPRHRHHLVLQTIDAVIAGPVLDLPAGAQPQERALVAVHAEARRGL